MSPHITSRSAAAHAVMGPSSRPGDVTSCRKLRLNLVGPPERTLGGLGVDSIPSRVTGLSPPDSPGCVVTTFDFTINSSGGGPVSDSHWDDGTISQGTAPCSVTVKAPSGDIVLVGDLGDHWTISSIGSFSSCAFTGSCNSHGGTCTNCTGVDAPSSCPPPGIPNCTNNRPSCSAGLNGNASDTAHVQCLP